MGFGKHLIQGIEFDLTHLDSAVIDVLHPVPGGGSDLYRVLVTYGCHCFARELRHDDHPDFYYQDGGTTRCICPDRTALSKHLPGIIRDAANGGLAYFSQGINMLLIEEIAEQVGPYCVFFDIEQSSQSRVDANLFVLSAYIKDALPERLPAVKFARLVERASKGHRPFQPQKTKRWKKG